MIKSFKTGAMLLVVASSFLNVSCNKNDDGEYVKVKEGVENGYFWVDLGLSVKWAIMNVGATTPLDCGDFFAWGETKPKNTYDYSTYFDFEHGSNRFKKYYNNGGITTLDLADDAAHINWGGSWRMPTRAELDELYNNCTWKWINIETVVGTVQGYEGVSKKNNASIFLPVAEYGGENRPQYGGSYYWSSSLGTLKSSEAYSFYFASGLPSWHGDVERCYGHTIRAVCKSNRKPIE